MYLPARIIATENKRRRSHTRIIRGIPFRYNHRVDIRVRTARRINILVPTRKPLLVYIVRNGYNTRTYVRTYVVYYLRGGSVAHADHKQQRRDAGSKSFYQHLLYSYYNLYVHIV